MAGHTKSDGNETTNTIDRRQFVASLTTAGAVATIGGMAATAESAPRHEQAVAVPTSAAADFPRPAGVKPGAQLDSRFPVSFAETVGNGLRLVAEYFTALSQRDLQALSRTLHFPFAIYEDIEPIVVASAADFTASPPPSLNGTGKGKTRIKTGSYDLLESINVHLYCPVGGVFSLSFTRYTPDGHKLLACDGIYSVTNNDGRWGIQLASTIVHEADFLGVSYPDAEAADIRGNQNYLAAFGYDNEKALNDPRSMRGSYEAPAAGGHARGQRQLRLRAARALA